MLEMLLFTLCLCGVEGALLEVWVETEELRDRLWSEQGLVVMVTVVRPSPRRLHFAVVLAVAVVVVIVSVVALPAIPVRAS